MQYTLLVLTGLAAVACGARVTVVVENVPSNFGAVRVTGSARELKEWDPCNGLLTRKRGNKWEVQVNLPAGEHSLKAIGYRSGNSCDGATWEPAGNTVFRVGSSSMTVTSYWGAGGSSSGGSSGGSAKWDSTDIVNGAAYFVYNRRPEGMRRKVYTRYYDGTDNAGVEKGIGNYCFITFKETDEGGDDANNARIGTSDVYNIRQSSPGRYNRVLRGYKGLAEPYNGLRLDLWNAISSECGIRPEIKYVFNGFSRGGGLAAIAAAAVYKEGLLQARQIAVVTFGAVRALTRRDANSVHGKFEQWRIVYRNDGVPSAIPSILGVSHYGWNIIKDGEYRAGQNAPSGRWDNYGDHDCCYRTWFPVQYWDPTPGHKNY